ncbi:Fur family transcriptional regulator, peroxide stress response regulator [Desulfonispora thiosulfatigenes DSM 11270]|uniref:Fur family transcriptional regulator, peroxide stress response regulator n=1 Tax=Desulfonispora thiosulfatigenes DSM 11270 TaxID=656914 RepID=A0A1W1URI5_DESTI|nr:Fur family transcriptional regulator [Desulfonispora thiosulfatigenes]SMB83421.1 Fur family transcriptional regulator, peroxide stress response regulator [Desulfonispora thiosulfatigenes DSM 11270]
MQRKVGINMTDIEKYLKENEIKPSYQRIRIYEYLIKYKNHPTVDNIYQELVQNIPTLSKTTVYNTLNIFLDKKIIQLIGIEENEMRYDADTSNHAHFKCKTCGKVYDIFHDFSKYPIKELEGFKILEEQMYFKGICKKCIN